MIIIFNTIINDNNLINKNKYFKCKIHLIIHLLANSIIILNNEYLINTYFKFLNFIIYIYKYILNKNTKQITLGNCFN